MYFGYHSAHGFSEFAYNNIPFVWAGMFIIDEFEFRDAQGGLLPLARAPQIGGGGTYAAIGARIFLDASQIGMIVDRGVDFPEEILRELLSYGEDMWFFRDREDAETTRALNKYMGQRRGFEYLTPHLRITPKDLHESHNLSRPSQLHLICSPTRAVRIVKDIKNIGNWNPFIIYEPIPDKCVPNELASLIEALPDISVLSPNSEEALSLLSITGPPTRELIQHSCDRFLEFGVGRGHGYVVIRSGHLGAYVASRGREGVWIPAFWQQTDQARIVDVTGAGNAFLGGLSAGILLTNGDVYEAAFYGSVSASFVIEQYGLPHLTGMGTWNHSEPQKRLKELQARMDTS